MKEQVKCPHCGGPSLYAEENPYRPFCSERCQLIDFGKWSEEEFRVPDTQTPVPNHDESYDESEEQKYLH